MLLARVKRYWRLNVFMFESSRELYNEEYLEINNKPCRLKNLWTQNRKVMCTTFRSLELLTASEALVAAIQKTKQDFVTSSALFTSRVVKTILATEEKYVSQRNWVCWRRARILSWPTERVIDGTWRRKRRGTKPKWDWVNSKFTGKCMRQEAVTAGQTARRGVKNPAFSSTFHCFYLLPQTCVDLSESLPHWKRKKYWRLVSLIWFFQLEWNAVILVKSSFCFVISHSDINKHIFTQTI